MWRVVTYSLLLAACSAPSWAQTNVTPAGGHATFMSKSGTNPNGVAATNDAPVARIGKQTIPYSQLQTQKKNKLEKRQAQHAAQLQQVNLAYERSQQTFIECGAT
jgi:hypothetical protein